MSRGRIHFVERTVDAVADLELGLERLEVNVGRASLNGFVENEVDVANDRGGVGLGGDRVGIEIVEADAVVAELDFRSGAELRKDVFHGAVFVAVGFGDQLVDAGDVLADAELDFPSEGKSKIFRCLAVERVSQRDEDGVFGRADGERSVESGESTGDEAEDFRRRRELGQVVTLDPKRVSDGLIENVFGDVTLLDEELFDGFARLGAVAPEVVGCGLVENAGVFEEISNLGGDHEDFRFSIFDWRLVMPGRPRWR